MNDRVELLKQVESALPSRWRSYVANDYEWLNWSVPTGQFDRTFPDPGEYVESCELVLWDDMRSAKAIVAMLDYMDHHGWSGYLTPILDPLAQPSGDANYEFFLYNKPDMFKRVHQLRASKGVSVGQRTPRQEFFGDTRAEAVAKAFVAVVGLIQELLLGDHCNTSEQAGKPSETNSAVRESESNCPSVCEENEGAEKK